MFEMTDPVPVSFVGGESGVWHIERIDAVVGQALPAAPRLSVLEGPTACATGPVRWILRGATSNTRYTTRAEVEVLVARQAGLNRPEATRAALIPIRKSAAWWALAQDERRAIFEEQSRHIRIGLDVLPGVARRLHHARELGEPFDFLTWFEYAPDQADAFEAMVSRLRDTPEWAFVEHEVDIRLGR